MSSLTVPAGALSSSTLAAIEEISTNSRDSEILKAILSKLRSGEIELMSRDDYLTPNKCAQLLGVSRAHFNKILDAGMLPYRVVGERDRRISARDFSLFVAHTENTRRVAAYDAAHAEDQFLDLLEDM